MKKRLLALLLASMMLTGSLAACSESPAQGDDTSAAETTPEVTTEPEETKLPSGLPEDKKLNGFTITFYGKNTKGAYAEEETGDLINDEVYARNRRLNEQYDFNIVEILPANQTDPTKEILATVQAGDDAYQVLVDGPNRFVSYINGGLLYDMSTLKYQNYSQPWWSEDINKSLSFQNKVLMSCNSFMLSSRSWIYHPMVNIDLLEANGMKMADYYNMAREGTWTTDEFIKMIKKGNADLNGDGVRDHNDRFGFETEAYGGYVLAIGTGYAIANKDDKDMPIITAATEEGVSLWDKLVNEIFSDRNSFLCVTDIVGVDSIWTTATNMMKNSQIMVQISTLGDGWREYEINYGILPVPKATPEQEKYYHTGSSYNLPVMAVPKIVQNPDEISFALEAMAYDSYYNLQPKFYQNYLETKLARDKESVEMLQIIHSTIMMDPGAAYNWGGYLNRIYNNVKLRENGLVTHHASNSEKAAKAIEDMVKAVTE
ncbi:MAG: hypothetical protein E7662_11275 [Ruminococcaceae bacterium]|nr:hypothetical protein [Oscillospiraceae bacterium]